VFVVCPPPCTGGNEACGSLVGSSIVKAVGSILGKVKVVDLFDYYNKYKVYLHKTQFEKGYEF
jgi:hypothetical protein